MKKYEYRIENFQGLDLSLILNNCGAKGWECITIDFTGLQIAFKREIIKVKEPGFKI